MRRRRRERGRERVYRVYRKSRGYLGTCRELGMYMCTYIYIYIDYRGLCKDYSDITPIVGNQFQKNMKYYMGTGFIKVYRGCREGKAEIVWVYLRYPIP